MADAHEPEHVGVEMGRPRPASSWPQLSMTSILFLAIWVLIGVVLALQDASNLVVEVVVFVPPILVLVYLRRKSAASSDVEPEPWDKILRFFATGFLPASIVVIVVELILSLIFVIVCFHGNLQEGLQYMGAVAGDGGGSGGGSGSGADASGGGSEAGSGSGGGTALPAPTLNVYVFLLLTSYITAGTTEEVAKAMILRFAVCPSRPMCVQGPDERAHARTTLLYMVAGAVGFSTVENIMYTWGALLSGGADDAVFWQVLVQGLVRALVALPTHTLCAGMTAARLVHRDREQRTLPNPLAAHGWLWVLFPAIFVHGTYDAQAMVLSVAVDSVWLVLVTSLTMLALGAWVFWHQWKTYGEPLDTEYARHEPV
uniref:PrsW family intramembrane metalloprotease n=1 Tax=Bicosoecida sp. CB-2014 TaxID=1486930 RepID=A0A7S1CDW0_9STRA|mmetsp:Transcript_23340/g.81351  ORF Transcript_23340/g.81351 Transcript_23340/m.81351 type:complete len:371 (+) Transcript_23340:142-1254(+)